MSICRGERLGASSLRQVLLGEVQRVDDAHVFEEHLDVRPDLELPVGDVGHAVALGRVGEQLEELAEGAHRVAEGAEELQQGLDVPLGEEALPVAAPVREPGRLEQDLGELRGREQVEVLSAQGVEDVARGVHLIGEELERDPEQSAERADLVEERELPLQIADHDRGAGTAAFRPAASATRAARATGRAGVDG